MTEEQERELDREERYQRRIEARSPRCKVCHSGAEYHWDGSVYRCLECHAARGER